MKKYTLTATALGYETVSVKVVTVSLESARKLGYIKLKNLWTEVNDCGGPDFSLAFIRIRSEK